MYAAALQNLSTCANADVNLGDRGTFLEVRLSWRRVTGDVALGSRHTHYELTSSSDANSLLGSRKRTGFTLLGGITAENGLIWTRGADPIILAPGCLMEVELVQAHDVVWAAGGRI
jgi:hypothetical protein